MYKYSDVEKEKKVLVGVLQANRRSILDLKRIEEDSDRIPYRTHIIRDRREVEEPDEEVNRNQSPPTIELNTGLTQVEDDGWPGWWTSTDKKYKGSKEGKYQKQEKGLHVPISRSLREMSFDSSMPARSASRPRNSGILVPSSSSNRLHRSNSNPERLSKTDDPSAPSTTPERLAIPSSSSEVLEFPSEISVPVTDNTDCHPSETVNVTEPGSPQILASTPPPARKHEKSPESPLETDIVTPTAQWFLSVVPHESDVKALIVRPRSEKSDHLRARAEATAKTLLLNWTNIDPESISGNQSQGSNQAETYDPHAYETERGYQTTNQQYQMPYAFQTYPPQVYPNYVSPMGHMGYPLLPPAPTVTTLPATDSSLPAAPSGPYTMPVFSNDDVQGDDTGTETVDVLHTSQESETVEWNP